ncbi:hypothetical protein [Salipiger thiooxidans]|uniref:hypothetical protein n=1 Tax=Salipiger thiooxidans TaxID=282683 RepID=UPI001CD4CDC0|nr:hypothetical protein [Salipiger thiooxidans]MCA0848312.1 hypothetical protein [Salipiger thiooxidans]
MSSARRNSAQQAGILCNDKGFQRFVAERCGFPGEEFGASAAAQFLRSFCGINSRRALDTDEAAQASFGVLRTEFDAWAGRIAAPR